MARRIVVCKVYHVGMSSTIGQALAPQADVVALAETQLCERLDWSEAQRKGAATAAGALIRDLPNRAFGVVGLAGAPGSGKSALAGLVCGVMKQLGTHALVLSLDNYYLGRQQRLELVRRHPLFAQRGVPGTHDWARLIGDLDRIREGRIEGLRLPRFDKSRDDRCEKTGFGRLKARPQLVILEGWLIGAPPQDPSALLGPVNQLEAERDPDGCWRGLVNDELARYHRDLAQRLHRRWFLAVPDWESVVAWRWQQETEGAGAERHLESLEAVARFLDQFQRIAMHMRATCGEWADVVVRLDDRHVMHLD